MSGVGKTHEIKPSKPSVGFVDGRKEIQPRGLSHGDGGERGRKGEKRGTGSNSSGGAARAHGSGVQ